MTDLAALDAKTLSAQLRQTGKSFLSSQKMASLRWHIQNCIDTAIPGDFVEFGVALGGTAVLTAHMLRDQPNRRFTGYDVFAQIPPPGDNDSDDAHRRFEVIAAGDATGLGKDEAYYGYLDDLLGRVTALFADYGLNVDGERIRLIKGLFEDAVPGTLPEHIALAHVDCDWYDPVHFCLNSIADRVSPGGVIIADDYLDFEGCRKAVDEFLEGRPDYHLQSARRHGVLIRKGA